MKQDGNVPFVTEGVIPPRGSLISSELLVSSPP